MRQIRSLDTQDTLEVAAQLPSLRVPAAVVWGAAARLQKLPYGQRLARGLTGRLETVAGGKHFMPEDHPEAIAAATIPRIAHLLELARNSKMKIVFSQDTDRVLAASDRVSVRGQGHTTTNALDIRA